MNAPALAPDARLRAAAANLQAWLIGEALPLWYFRGIDWRRGGFFDQLGHDAANDLVDYKRLRVLARQIYVFAQAAELGWPKGREVVAHGLDFLFNRALRPDGGYALRFDRDGEIIDDGRDLYDSAFVLLGLAQAYRVSRDALMQGAALNLYRYLLGHLAHPSGGFCEGRPATLPRQQNGHMHLFEALIACTENGWGEPFASAAGATVDLFRRRFYDAERGSLPEQFDDALQPLAADNFVEPGHCYEWSWLLATWSRIGRRSAMPEAGALYDFARRHGSNAADSPVCDELHLDGGVRLAGARLWPQTERIKAALIRYETSRDARDAEDALQAVAVLHRYIDAASIRGLWRERIAADGSWSEEPVRASSLYHIVAAIAELARIVEKI